jgi:hypothetical protein
MSVLLISIGLLLRLRVTAAFARAPLAVRLATPSESASEPQFVGIISSSALTCGILALPRKPFCLTAIKDCANENRGVPANIRIDVHGLPGATHSIETQP